jgi:hypothetical protein
VAAHASEARNPSDYALAQVNATLIQARAIVLLTERVDALKLPVQNDLLQIDTGRNR